LTSPFAAPDGSSTTCRTESSPDAERYGCGERNSGKQDRWPGNEHGQAPGDYGRKWRMHRVNKPEAAENKVSCEDESGYSSGDYYK
jgi:hypothetical protein